MKAAAPAVLAACALLAAAGPASSQEKPTLPSSAASEQKPAEPGTNLDLKLEDPALSSRPRIRFGPAEPQDAGGLPSLGADARKVEEIPRSGSRTSPYPPDTNPGR
jgi:hypothetical protein